MSLEQRALPDRAGVTGATGATSPTGATGATGSTGPTGADAPPNYSAFFLFGDPPQTQTVAANMPVVFFSTDLDFLPIGTAITYDNTTGIFTINEPGYYEINTGISVKTVGPSNNPISATNPVVMGVLRSIPFSNIPSTQIVLFSEDLITNSTIVTISITPVELSMRPNQNITLTTNGSSVAFMTVKKLQN